MHPSIEETRCPLWAHHGVRWQQGLSHGFRMPSSCPPCTVQELAVKWAGIGFWCVFVFFFFCHSVVLGGLGSDKETLSEAAGCRWAAFPSARRSHCSQSSRFALAQSPSVFKPNVIVSLQGAARFWLSPQERINAGVLPCSELPPGSSVQPQHLPNSITSPNSSPPSCCPL